MGSLISIASLTSDEACYQQVRALLWPERVVCLHCGSRDTIRWGKDNQQPERQHYLCKAFDKRFDDLTDTVFVEHHQPLKVWTFCPIPDITEPVQPHNCPRTGLKALS